MIIKVVSLKIIAHISRELVPGPKRRAWPISFNHPSKILHVDTVIFPFSQIIRGLESPSFT